MRRLSSIPQNQTKCAVNTLLVSFTYTHTPTYTHFLTLVCDIISATSIHTHTKY
eukprot:m.368134 g.368134  ORF g.368134 m.368134 type:complete len:54 (+) comp43994_c0_seq1:62-223(+)